jgi:cytochrome c oxidase assembly protein subunit 15
LVANVGIVVTGGAVRLTASGLGCPTVPRCTEDSMVATREMGVHGAIEFGNRLLTFAVTAAVLVALVTAWRARRRDLVALSVLLVLGILGQAVLGAVTVLTGLDPLTVMAHFLVSMVLFAVAVRAHGLAGADGAPQGGLRREVRGLARLLTTAVAATLVVGTVVTGTGPHSGDEDATDRLPFDLEAVSQLHADLVFLVVGLTVGLLVAVRASGARHPLPQRVQTLLVVVLAQGLVGFVQYATDLPAALVAAHILGACLVWVATLRVLLLTHTPAPEPGGDMPEALPVVLEHEPGDAAHA